MIKGEKMLKCSEFFFLGKPPLNFYFVPEPCHIGGEGSMGVKGVYLSIVGYTGPEKVQIVGEDGSDD